MDQTHALLSANHNCPQHTGNDNIDEDEFCEVMIQARTIQCINGVLYNADCSTWYDILGKKIILIFETIIDILKNSFNITERNIFIATLKTKRRINNLCQAIMILHLKKSKYLVAILQH